MQVFRAATAWYAGLLSLVMIVYVLAPFHVGGLSNRHLRLVLHSKSSGDPRFGRTVAEIAMPYAALTALCAFGLSVLGVPPFTAMTAGLSALSTNGYLPVTTGDTLFNSAGAEALLMVFMAVGGTSIIWHRMAISRRWALVLQHRESWYFILAALAAGTLSALAALIIGQGGAQPGAVLLNRLFDAVSTLSTAGIVHNPGIGVQIPVLLLLMLGIAGATTYSPGGGLRLYRMGAMIAHAMTEARRLAFPRAVLSAHFGGLVDASGVARFVWSFFILYLLTMCLATLTFSGLGYPLEQSLALAVGSLSSVAGLVQEGLWGPGSAAAAAPDPLVRAAIAVAALAGRVEVLVILAAGARADW